MGGWDKAYQDKEWNLKELATIGFIQRFQEGLVDDEMHYERITPYYDIFIDILDHSKIREKISNMSNISTEMLRNIAEDIITSMLYNKENDPFISLGLPRNSTYDIMNKRWKRLLLIFHPDRPKNPLQDEEKAIKINEAYNRIKSLSLKQGKQGKEKFSLVQRKPFISQQKFFYFSRIFNIATLKKVAIFVMISIVIIFSFSLFAWNQKKNNESIYLDHNETLDVQELFENKADKFSQGLIPNRESHDAKAFQSEKGGTLFPVGEKSDEKVAILTEKNQPRNTKKLSKVQEKSSKTEKNNMISFIDKTVKRKSMTKEKRELGIQEKLKLPKEDDIEQVRKLKNLKLPVSENNLSINNLQFTEKIDQSSGKDESHHIIGKKDRKPIKRFLQQYIKYYRKGDLDAFLSLFDENATENGQAVSSIIDNYKKCFIGATNNYKIDNISFHFNNNDTVNISASYIIDRFYTQENKVYHYEGSIKWTIKKVKDEFKIVSIYYD